MDIGMELREERKRQGRTMADVASSLGLSEAYVSMVETGKRSPSAKILSRWLAVLAADPEFARRALEEVAGRDLEETGQISIHILAGHVLNAYRNTLQAASASESHRDAVRKLVATAARRGMAPSDFALVVKKILAEKSFQDFVVELARMPERERRRFVDAFSRLLPRTDGDDKAVNHGDE